MVRVRYLPDIRELFAAEALGESLYNRRRRKQQQKEVEIQHETTKEGDFQEIESETDGGTFYYSLRTAAEYTRDVLLQHVHQELQQEEKATEGKPSERKGIDPKQKGLKQRLLDSGFFTAWEKQKLIFDSLNAALKQHSFVFSHAAGCGDVCPNKLTKPKNTGNKSYGIPVNGNKQTLTNLITFDTP